MTCHNHATYMLMWPTAYLTHMPHCVSLSHTSYASGINISSHPPFAGYLDILDFSLYPESYESWVIVSHISHNESWWVIWLTWVMLSPNLKQAIFAGYLDILDFCLYPESWVIEVTMSHGESYDSHVSFWVIDVNLSQITNLSHFESYQSFWVI